MDRPDDHTITGIHPEGAAPLPRASMRPCLTTIIAVPCLFVAGILWCLEPWQRPGLSRVVPDVALLSAASLGLLAVAASLGLGRKPARGWRRAIVVFICGFILLGGTRLMFGRQTLSHLHSRLDREIHIGMFYWEEPGKSLSERLADILKSLRMGVPDWLARHVESRRSVGPPSTESLIASSRWPLRRALADSLIRDEKRSGFLLREWKRFFPAITGADVTLEHRRDWMKRLDHQRCDVSLGVGSRQAAIVCMALVVLTDPPEFESWRTRVRDMMLDWNEPLSPGAEVLWMRTLDTLLALDPPGSWTGLTQRMTARPEVVHHAMRIPVRGLAGDFDALTREFEEFERCNQTEHGFTLWQGLGASLERWPDQFDESEADRIRNWRRDVLFRWLMDHGRGTRKELTDTRGRVLLELTPQQQIQLSASAAEWARMACDEVKSAVKGADLSASRPFNIVSLIHPYLTDQQQTDLGRLLIPVMLRPDLFQRRGPLDSVRFDLGWTELLWKIRPLMNEEQRCALQIGLTPFMPNLLRAEHSSALLLWMDAWSDKPVLKPEVWLALAWHIKRGWRIVPKGTVIESMDARNGGPLPVPPVAGHAVESLARILDSAWTPGRTGFSSRLQKGLNGIDATASCSRAVAYFAASRIMNWQKSGLLDSHPVAELLAVELYLCGLHKLEDTQIRALKGIAENREEPFFSDFARELYLKDHDANPWMEILRNPRAAAQEAVSLIDDEKKSWALIHLIHRLENSPPDAAVIRAIWDALRQRSLQGGIEHKAMIFGMLFRLAPMLPHDEQMAMRRDYLAVSQTERFRMIAFHDADDWGMPWNPLDFPGGGLGIPWEHDELSTMQSWSSNIGRLTSLYPDEPTHLHSNSAFRFIALGVFPRFEGFNPVNSRLERRDMPPVSPPFEPTPWQMARELQLRDCLKNRGIGFQPVSAGEHFACWLGNFTFHPGWKPGFRNSQDGCSPFLRPPLSRPDLRVR